MLRLFVYLSTGDYQEMEGSGVAEKWRGRALGVYVRDGLGGTTLMGCRRVQA
jgi:hypothetical protein